ncbi:hypothetical protein SPRG_09686 [Saprolegnia parasitica CBS 223.65]|uniref:HSF-type DNA-binding domain-containing protein n=1 Tax=Saprolegnia parasitica (strain CBS 223.65) TaxID=695850 RepID=A0A067C249_SAPPC|nr:hypothetical protein SPRG_09686 [Saprolegnia parasitica CBS 223.65]KDO24854.1 hypothetical protein SPRG_09686 [Saprolegnia parasitica CBS 223.65]|eukprot:XP_012204500.1 hypothetical protein SPRG_09686 [Saprolegnia parasitica CBS 223.65]
MKSSSPSPLPKSHGVPTFVQSLYTMLAVEDPAVLAWTGDGLAFEIRDQDKLATSILPRYFRHAKYPSFQRQLNYFGFRKWSKQKAAVCTYGCPFFTRDAPQLLPHVSRRPRQAPSMAMEKQQHGLSSPTMELPPTDGLTTFLDVDMDDLCWILTE